ncbi:MAG: bifunctional nuclease family protein [Acidobacteriota bacterium]|nr:bifunctional nuclease family protein [Acidobacteriota bacterium]
MTEPAETIRMRVGGLILDPDSNTPIVVLRDAEGGRFLPIWIGPFEANAIVMRLEGVEAPRPMTHDLLLSGLQELQAEVRQILICDLKDNTFYARIYLSQGKEEIVLDARPSDAIALALRAEAPILVATSVLKEASTDERTTKLTEEERIRKWLEELEPEDLGEYEM